MATNDWEMHKHGYVLQLDDGKFISCILANGHPENPTIYTTKYIWEAKAWKSYHGVIKAANRMAERLGRCHALRFKYNAEMRAGEPAVEYCYTAEKKEEGQDARHAD